MKHLVVFAITLMLLSCSSHPKNLERKVQTVEFHYINWACACANWATADVTDRYADMGHLPEHCVFVEPADSSLILPDTIGYGNDIVQFTGQYYAEKGFPAGYIKGEEPVEKAQVFRYTSFKVINSNYHESLAEKIGSAKYLIYKGPLSGKTVTLDVSYDLQACPCAECFETKKEKPFNEGVERFYLEPANAALVQADTLFDGNNLPIRLKVTGRFYAKKGYPVNYFPSKGQPEPERVFRYNKIQVLQNGD